jgi:hypothetical protein
MEEKKPVGKITEWNPMGMRFKGNPRNRLEDEVLKGKNRTYLVKDRKAWYGLVQKNKTHKGL